MERLPIGAPNDAKMPFIDGEYSPDAQALGCGHHCGVSQTDMRVLYRSISSRERRTSAAVLAPA
jgi:hypothetical protein